MKSTVFFHPLPPHSSNKERGVAGYKVLRELLKLSAIDVAPELPIKLHFGERGNHTYLKPEVYDPLIDFLEEQGKKCFFTETSVLYGGERFEAARHIKLAHSHGFTRLPVIIADGEHGELSVQTPISGGKHFKSAAIAETLANASQVLVVSHFKGHMLAGFGGALKQLSMGFAAKGGKMAMHLSVTPRIKERKCKRCKVCLTRCNAGAITIGKSAVIDRNKCIGCGACFSICPQKAISVFSFAGLKNMLFGRRLFREKLAEYALAAHAGKKNIYLSFAVDVSGGCDCEPRRMSPCIHDIGVFASLDPVAIDTACYEAVQKAGKRFKGYEQLPYAAGIGVGTTDYELVQI